MFISKKEMKASLVSFILGVGIIRICFFSNTVFKAYSIIILSSLLLLIGKPKRLLREKTAFLLAAVISFSILRFNQNLIGMMNACTYFLQFYVPFLVCDFLFESNGIKVGMKGLLNGFTFISLMMDLSVLLGLEIANYQNLVTYLFGNKFMVSYLHMLTFGLLAEYWRLTEKDKKIKYRMLLLGYAIYSTVMSMVVKCSTGIVGMLVIMILYYICKQKTIKNFLKRPIVGISIYLGLTILLVKSNDLIKIPMIKYFIENILHEDISLTGRYIIYEMLPEIINKHLWFGYGYNLDLFAELIGYGNTQNGILQYILDCGLIGVVIFVMNWLHSIKMSSESECDNWPLICLLYGFIFCGLVEVCFKQIFIVLLAILTCFPIDNS